MAEIPSAEKLSRSLFIYTIVGVIVCCAAAYLYAMR